MSHIFLSYSRKDSVFADHLRDLLENEGFGVWMDRTQLMPSKEWEREIERAIRSCGAFLIIVSRNSQDSVPVWRELRLAEKHNKPIFPVWLDGAVWPQLAHLQVDDMRAGTGAPLSPRLAQALRAEVGERSRLVWTIGAVAVLGAMLVLIPLVALQIAAIAQMWGGGDDDDKTLMPTRTESSVAALPTGITPIPAGSAAGFFIRDEMTLNGVPFVYVPGGCFMMGSTEGESDERPVHEVCLSAYWIGQTEVTNAQYKQCVEADGCTKPVDTRYYDDAQYADHPVVNVDWNQASAYAAWLADTTGTEVTLPTEAQWEYAACGPEANRYPWGNSDATCELANISIDNSGCVGTTSPVGSYPAGASWVGALDMSGNVWEWVADWYGAYPAERQVNPTGVDSGSRRVLRGGSWDSDQDLARAVYRSRNYAFNRNSAVGFRVVRPPSARQ